MSAPDRAAILCVVHSRLLALLAAATADVNAKHEIARRAFSSANAVDDLKIARAYRRGIGRCIEELGHVEG